MHWRVVKKGGRAKVNTLAKFLSLIEEEEQQREVDNAGETVEACYWPYDGWTWNREPPPQIGLVPGHVLESVTSSWMNLLDKYTPYNITRNEMYLDCSKHSYYVYMYVVYVSLVHIQSFDFTTNMAGKVVALMTADLQNYLSLDTMTGMKSEINDMLNLILKSHLGNVNVPWSLPDAMDLLFIKGAKTIKDKSSYRKKRNGIDKILARGGYKVFYARDYITSLAKQWTSLLPEDEACLQDTKRYHGDDCMSNNSICLGFCQRMKEVVEGQPARTWRRLLAKATQPPLFQDVAEQDRASTWLLPFCFTGSKLSSMLDIIDNEKGRFSFPNNYSNYGYEFCKDAQWIYTDAGICTTFNYPRTTDVFFKNGIFNDITLQKKIKPKFKLLYPDKVAAKVLENGILLVLDTWGFTASLSRSLDHNTEGIMIHNELESNRLNSFRVILHDRHESPMVHSYDSTVLRLENFETASLSVRSYTVKVLASLRDAEDAIRSKRVEERNCKFSDETKGLLVSKRYTRQGCLFECKIKFTAKTCNCTPWNYPQLPGYPMCGFFGNLCFHDKMILLKHDIFNVEELGSPPCGCYPDCRVIRYSLEAQNPVYAHDNFGWLNLTGVNAEVLNKTSRLPFFTKYVTDVYRGEQSLLNPGWATLNDPSWNGRADDLTMLYVGFGREKFPKRKQIIRATFGDMLSAIGGTVGLFTGISFMTFVDLKFWILATFDNVRSKF